MSTVAFLFDKIGSERKVVASLEADNAQSIQKAVRKNHNKPLINECLGGTIGCVVGPCLGVVVCADG